MTKLILLALLATTLPAYAFDLGKMLSDAVDDVANEIVNDNINDVKGLIRKKVPSITDISVEKVEAKPGINVDFVYNNQGIIVYTTKTCSTCADLTNYLQTNNLPYIEKDINKDVQGANEYRALNQSGVPITLVKSDMVRGFSQNSMDQVLINNKFK